MSDPLGGRSLAELNVARPWAEQVLREVGLPVTRPRLLVLIALRERERPMTAQDLHWELGTWLRRDRARGAAPGMTTVYRVLAALAERGVLHCFHHGGAVTAYRLCPPIRHHHLVCRCCGRVQEQPPGPVTEWLAALTVPDGFAIEDYHAEMVGLCGACRPDATRPAHDRTDAATENA